MRVKGGKFLSLVSFFYIVVAIVFLSFPTDLLPDYIHKPRLMFFGILAFAGLLYLPRVIFIWTKGKILYQKRKSSLLKYENLFAVGLFVSSMGDLGFYQFYRIGFNYDKLVHFILPFFAVISAGGYLINGYRQNWLKALFLAASIVMIGGIVWEAVEFSVDKIFGTHLWGVDSRDVFSDTKADLYADFLGTLLGLSAQLIRYSLRGEAQNVKIGSTRRRYTG